MKFLINELNKFVDISDKSKDELIDIFTSLAFEVEEVYPASNIKGARLTVVENCIKHPKADKLNYLQSTINGNKLDVVCGGANIKTGQIVAHAIPGSKVGDIEMNSKELRGIVSNGMILSISEIMGLPKSLIENGEEKNIFVFDKNTDISKDPIELLELKGNIFDLSILPDRQYASNYFSMAREISAFIERDLNFKIDNVERTEKNNSKVILGNEANSIYVTNVKLNKNVKTPFWIKRVLYHSGIKPTNTIEDVIAYSMLMTGAITYVLDRQEEYKLDGRKLNSIDIFESKALNSLNDEVSFVTVGSDKRSNFVNEKNLNLTFGSRAIKGTNSEAAKLTSDFVLDIAKKAGYLVSASETISEVNKIDKKFEIEDSYIYSYLGKEIDLKLISKKLNLLKIIKNKNTYEIPSYRNDIIYKADVVEEIARIYGVSNIEAKSYSLTSDKVNLEPHKNALFKITDELSKYGFYEVKTYQLISDQEAKENNIWNLDNFIKLRKDYSVEYNTLQTSLLHGLIESYKINHRKDKEDIRLFELSNIFYNEKPVYSVGILHDEKINESEPILATKELVLKVLESLKIDLNKISFVDEKNDAFNPYISSSIRYNNEKIGLIGEIHPSILRKNKFIRLDKIKAKLFYAELKLETII